MKTSKEQILQAALMRFSEAGYEGTKLQDIALSLGITKAALYRHFESKEALWNDMISCVEEYYNAHIGLWPGDTLPRSQEQLMQLTFRQVEFTMHDETVVQMRRLLSTEQFRSPRVAALADRHFYSDVSLAYARLFAAMAQEGILQEKNASALALAYTAPITVLIHRCDRDDSALPQALAQIQEHIGLFCRLTGLPEA